MEKGPIPTMNDDDLRQSIREYIAANIAPSIPFAVVPFQPDHLTGYRFNDSSFVLCRRCSNCQKDSPSEATFCSLCTTEIYAATRY